MLTAENLNQNEWGEREGLNVVFDEIIDPRVDRTKKYQLNEILFLSLCAILSEMDGWRSIELYGREKIDLLRQYLPFKHGIPTFCTIARVFSVVPPSSFEALFMRFMRWMTKSDQEIIAIDGKTLRRSYDTGIGVLPLHILNVWAVNRGLCIGQVAVDEKTNEITALPEVLDHLDLRGSTVTVDGLNTQKAIAEKIITKGGDYLMPVKGNHSNLEKALEALFLRADIEIQPSLSKYKTTEKCHGRIETRVYTCIKNVTWLPSQEQWRSLTTLCKTENIVFRDGKEMRQTRYYISSLDADAKKIGTAIRAHWGVENSLHWVLDVTFGEDQSRKRKDHAPRNFSLLRKIAINMVKLDTTSKHSLVLRRKKASMNERYFAGSCEQVTPTSEVQPDFSI